MDEHGTRNAATMARILERSSNRYLLLDPDRTWQPLVVRDQLLVDADNAAGAEEALAPWVARRENFSDQRITRLHLDPAKKVDLVDVVTTATRGQRPRGVTLNHVLRGVPGYAGGPMGVPTPANPVAAPGASLAGSGSVVAVLDTGVSSAHPWFAPGSWLPVDGLPTDDEVDHDSDYELDAQAGHGTFVAGVVRRESPAATLLLGRVLGSDGLCTELALVDAIDKVRRTATRRGLTVDVLNLSLGGYLLHDRPSPHVSKALRRLGRDTVVVASAGNAGGDEPYYPAAGDDVVAVASTDTGATARAAWSNHGPWVDACAVGEHVTSAFVVWDGDLQETVGVEAECFQGFAAWSGTSFAAPVVAGRIAAYAADKGVTAPEAWDALQADAPDLPEIGRFIATQDVSGT